MYIVPTYYIVEIDLLKLAYHKLARQADTPVDSMSDHNPRKLFNSCEKRKQFPNVNLYQLTDHNLNGIIHPLLKTSVK